MNLNDFYDRLLLNGGKFGPATAKRVIEIIDETGAEEFVSLSIPSAISKLKAIHKFKGGTKARAGEPVNRRDGFGKITERAIVFAQKLLYEMKREEIELAKKAAEEAREKEEKMKAAEEERMRRAQEERMRKMRENPEFTQEQMMACLDWMNKHGVKTLDWKKMWSFCNDLGLTFFNSADEKKG